MSKKQCHCSFRDRGFYTVSQLGKTREVTPEGFLLCRDVAIARTGSQVYSDQELPLETKTGEIVIDRVADEVFRDETILSFNGKAVTVEHPDDFVTPENWNKLAVGTVQNARRGTGVEDDLLIADLLITSADAIAYVNESLPEVSCGYDADYEQTEPGRGLQRNIVGNHVALVERGRAGPRCSIKDGAPQMKKKRSFWDRLMTAVKAQDEEAVKAELEAMDEEGEENPESKMPEKAEAKDQDPMADFGARLAKIEAVLSKLVPVEETEHAQQFDDEEEEETNDTLIEPETNRSNPEGVGKVLSGDSMKAIISRAEVLSPGIAIPTGDAAKSGKVLQSLMRKSLDAAYGTDKGRQCIEPFLMGRDIKKLTGDALMGVFNGSAELMKTRNNDSGVRSGITTQDFGRATTAADINRRNAEFWARK